jgi:hypothetical protein
MIMRRFLEILIVKMLAPILRRDEVIVAFPTSWDMFARNLVTAFGIEDGTVHFNSQEMTEFESDQIQCLAKARIIDPEAYHRAMDIKIPGACNVDVSEVMVVAFPMPRYVFKKFVVVAEYLRDGITDENREVAFKTLKIMVYFMKDKQRIIEPAAYFEAKELPQ